MHICPDEIYAVLNVIPWVGTLVTRARAWVHEKLSCKHVHLDETDGLDEESYGELVARIRKDGQPTEYLTGLLK